jgi:hypothetical protein
MDAAAFDRLDELKANLRGMGLPNYASQTDVVSAAVLFTTPEQLAGMLAAYWRSTEPPPTD